MSNNIDNNNNEGEIPLLSKHLERFKGVSQEKLMSFVSQIKNLVVPGQNIGADGQQLIYDFIDTSSMLILEYKQEIKTLREMLKLPKGVDTEIFQVKTTPKQRFTSQSDEVVELPINDEDQETVYHPPFDNPPLLSSTRLHDHSSITLDFHDEENTSNLRPDGVQMINLSRLVKKPNYFDGCKPLPREWIEEYMDAMEDNCWNDATARYYFKHFLKGEAALWFKFSVRPKLNNNSTFRTILRLFEFQFLGRAEKERVTLLLENLTMKYNERVAVFVPKVQQYLHILNPKMRESEIVDIIERKLRSEYASAIIDAEPKTISELMAACRKAEAKADLAKAAKDRSNTSQSFNGRYNQNNRDNKRLDQSNRTHNGSASNRPSCKRCHWNNHNTKDCYASHRKDGTKIEDRTSDDKKPKPKHTPDRKPNYNHKPNSSGKRSPQKSTNLIDTVGSCSSISSSEEVTVTTNMVILKSVVALSEEKEQFANTNFIWQEVKCNDMNVRALVDSGAAVSVMDHALALKVKAKIRPTSWKLDGANCLPLDIVGSMVVTIELKIGNTTKSKRHRLVVVKNLSTPLLFGADLLQDFKISINFQNRTLSFNERKENHNSKSKGLILAKNETISPRSRHIVQVDCPIENDIVTIPFKFNENILVANTVTSNRNGNAYIMIVNLADQTIPLTKGTKVAGFELYDPIVKTQEKGELISLMLPIPNSDQKICVGDQLNESQLKDLNILLKAHYNAFSLNGEIGCAKSIKHTIELEEGAEPVKEKARRRPRIHEEEARKQVNKMLEENIIRESDSPWTSQYVIVKKKTGDLRICLDFRRLNDLTKKNVYPLPNIQNCLDRLAGKLYYSQFDLASGYWQVELDDKAKEMTAFQVDNGLYEFVRMPFGLSNAPSTFQKLMNHLLSGMDEMEVQVYLDDVCLATFDWPRHIWQLDRLLTLFEKENLKLKASKCLLGAPKIKFLGHELSAEGIAQDMSKLDAIRKQPKPTDVSGVRRLLGSLNYYRKFTPKFAVLSSPLIELTKKNAKFEWGELQDKAFNDILDQLTSRPVLATYDHIHPTRVKTDASIQGIAGILEQFQEEQWRLICCCSRRLNAAESKYAITELEGLAVVYALEEFRCYLLGIKFDVLVDHCALCVLKGKMPTNARLHRWALLLMEFDFKIVYIKGGLHNDADCLSRNPIDIEDTDYRLDDKILTIRVPITKDEWCLLYDNSEGQELITKAAQNIDKFTLIEDIIYFDERLYIPEKERPSFLKQAHSSLLAGHGGRAATAARLENVWWPNMFSDISKYVDSCPECQSRKAIRRNTPGTMHNFSSTAPFESIAIDTCGPLTETVLGSKYVIVMIDLFTRFIEARALRDVQAPDTGNFIMDCLGRYGPPNKIYSDNGPQFDNDHINGMLELFGIQRQWVTPDHSQGNSPVERVIQTLQDKLSLNCLTQKEFDHWDLILPTVVLSINTTVHSAIQKQPFQLMFGRKFNVNKRKEGTTPLTLHNELIESNLYHWRAEAIEQNQSAQERSRPHFDRTHRVQEFKVKDLVMMRVPNKRRGKLEVRFKGPFEVLSKSNDVYKIKDSNSGQVFERHTESLRPYNDRPTTLNSRIGVIFLGLLLVLCGIDLHAYPLTPAEDIELVDPNFWSPATDKIVLGSKVRITIHLSSGNPFNSVQEWSEKYNYSSPELEEGLRQAESHAFQFCKTQKRQYNELVRELVDVVKPQNEPRGLVLAATLSYAVFQYFVSTYSMESTSPVEAKKFYTLEKIDDLILAKIGNLTRAVETMGSDMVKHNMRMMKYYEINHAITRSSNQLEDIIDTHKHHGHVNVMQLSRLTNITMLKSTDAKSTKFVSVEVTNEIANEPYVIKIVLDAIIPSIDTHIYDYGVIDHWIRTHDSFEKISYTGPRWALVNETNKCVKPLIDVNSRIVLESCLTPGKDRKFDSFNVVKTVNNWEDITLESEIRVLDLYTLTQCFPGWALINGNKLRCDMRPFKTQPMTSVSTIDNDYSPRQLEFKAEILNQDLFHESPFTSHNKWINETLDMFTEVHKLREEAKKVSNPLPLIFNGLLVTIFIIIACYYTYAYYCVQPNEEPTTTHIITNFHSLDSLPSPRSSRLDPTRNQ